MFSGEVALLKEKAHRKPKSKKSVLPAPEPIAGPSNYPHALNHTQQTHTGGSSSHSHPTGSKDTPIALLSDGEDNSGKRRTRGSVDSPNEKKKRRVVDIVCVPQWFVVRCTSDYPPYRSIPSIRILKRQSRISRWPSRKVRYSFYCSHYVRE